ncbi:hypothetical protein M0812_27439 [Anaeramoeba flamelloides]|uniref:WW domain-containing protein n=1 Tax=Anaeramoeba flamelloides TaxID=1746091 RepID=A0AAV7Y694_9EUKA|nr:hypothetical protein M0812_27439 [Anaeramoeba flamelloides]
MEEFFKAQKRNFRQLNRFTTDVIYVLKKQIQTENIITKTDFAFVFSDFLFLLGSIESFLNKAQSQLKKDQDLVSPDFWLPTVTERGVFILFDEWSKKICNIFIEFARISKSISFRKWILERSKEINKNISNIVFFAALTKPIKILRLYVNFFQTLVLPKMNSDKNDKKTVRFIQNKLIEVNENAIKQRTKIIELEKLYRIDSQVIGEVVINLVTKNRKIQSIIKIGNIHNLTTTMVSRSVHTLYVLTDILLFTKPEPEIDSIRCLYLIPIQSITYTKSIENQLYINSTESLLKIQFNSTEEIKNILNLIKLIQNNSRKSINLKYGYQRIDKLEKKIKKLEKNAQTLSTDVINLKERLKNKKPKNVLPRNWKRVLSQNGQEYYFNIKTFETSWEIPTIIHNDWRKIKTRNNRFFYLNPKTQQITLSPPEEIDSDILENELEEERIKREKIKLMEENKKLEIQKKKLLEIIQIKDLRNQISKAQKNVDLPHSPRRVKLEEQEQEEKQEEKLEEQIWFEIYDHEKKKFKYYGKTTKIIRVHLPKEAIIVKLSEREAEEFLSQN